MKDIHLFGWLDSCEGDKMDEARNGSVLRGGLARAAVSIMYAGIPIFNRINYS